MARDGPRDQWLGVAVTLDLAFPPIVAGPLLAGSMVIGEVFSLPGMARLARQRLGAGVLGLVILLVALFGRNVMLLLATLGTVS